MRADFASLSSLEMNNLQKQKQVADFNWPRECDKFCQYLVKKVQGYLLMEHTPYEAHEHTLKSNGNKLKVPNH